MGVVRVRRLGIVCRGRVPRMRLRGGMLGCWDLALVLILLWLLAQCIAHGVGRVGAMGGGIGHYGVERGEWSVPMRSRRFGEEEGIMRELR
ncbi:hypothetical protein LXA43DRAFT_1018305 [Ganoderma leucocontextum]|nr:hypothetical protein LXA43DRAFT_1018305 [Ganoderma leucocontextum]